MLTYLLFGGGALVAIVLLVIASQPNTFRVERSAVIPAPPPLVFDQVNELRNWRGWSPWEQVDPNLQRSYEGPAAGVGAVYAWNGNSQVGAGKMTITASRPHEHIAMRLDFYRPFAATNAVEFTFAPADDHATRVTWAMSGPKNFFAKALHLVINIDKMCGGQFEQGLNTLKTVAATTPLVTN